MNRESALNILVVGCCGVGKVSRSDTESKINTHRHTEPLSTDLLHKSTHKLGTLSPSESQSLQELQSHTIRSRNRTPLRVPTPHFVANFSYQTGGPVHFNLRDNIERGDTHMLKHDPEIDGVIFMYDVNMSGSFTWLLMRYSTFVSLPTPHQTNRFHKIAYFNFLFLLSRRIPERKTRHHHFRRQQSRRRLAPEPSDLPSIRTRSR